MAPKVFISHASEDKERFVIRFAETLRCAGIEAWLDQWELRPGDSLIHRFLWSHGGQFTAVADER